VPAKPQPISPVGAREGSDPAKPVVRQRAGIGSYEDPGDARREKRRPGKTGRPGR
jgi:excinuclease ABC subunit B